MCWYGRRTCELCVTVHTSECIRHTIGSRACCHIIRVERTSGTTAGCYGEVLLILLEAFLFVCTCYRVLETRRVRRVTRDRNVNALSVHDRNAFLHVICTITVYFGTESFGIRNAGHLFHRIRIRVILCLNKCKTVDTGNDLCRIFSQSVQNNAERFFTHFVCFLCDSDRTFRCGKRLMAGKETEALGLLLKEHLAQVSMSQTYFTGIGNRTRDTKCLQSLSDCCGCVRCPLAALFDRDRSAYGISPARVLKTDRLNAFDLIVYVQTGIFRDLLRLFNRGDAVFVQHAVDFIYSSFI